MQYGFYKLFILLAIILWADRVYAIEDSNATVIDTLVLYNQEVVDRYGGEQNIRIEHLITVTNNIFADSGLNIKINVVKMQQYYMDVNSSARTIIQNIREDSNITALRNRVGADEVLIYRPYNSIDRVCGLGYINKIANPDYAYAYVGINCSSYHTAHEIGHNLGLYHSEKSFPNVGYARGYGVDNDFETIMAYKGEYNGTKIYKFSSPELDCDGQPCGVDEGYEHEADAVKAIKLNVIAVSAFRNSTTENNITKAQELYEFYREKYQEVSNKKDELYQEYSLADNKYQEALSAISNKTDNYKLYILSVQRNKLYLSYITYVKEIYSVIKDKYENAKRNFDRLKEL